MTISIKEASARSNISQKTIRRHIHADTLKSCKKNNSYAINISDFNNWVKNVKSNTKKIISTKIFNINDEVVANDYSEVKIESDFKNDYWSNPNNNGLKFADFFAGAGGLTTGFVQAGYKPIYSVEIMPSAIRTYNSNISLKFNDSINNTKDITNDEVKKEAIKKLKSENVDLIIGGFPCQGFSMAGSRVVDDPRNSLYLHMLQIVKAVSPKIVVMENVVGLRSMLNGNVEKKIIKDFQKAGYKISVKTLNSADYKVPQKRKRVIFIANKINKINLYPKPLVQEKNYTTVKQAINDLQNIKENIDFNHSFTKHKKITIDKISSLQPGRSLYKGYSDAWKRVYWDKPSPTVKENHGGVFIHPIKDRVMTPRELARLQSFPDDFIFKGSKKWQLVQIGNAVPPLMAKAIALSIKNMFN